MILYYTPGACSLATRISLREAGVPADFEKVDLKAKVTELGADFKADNSKGSVPVLVLEDGSTITENVAILDLLADREPALRPDGPLGRTRLIEMLSYLSSEVHVAFKPLWHPGSDADKEKGRQAVAQRLNYLDSRLADPFLLGPRFTVADAYLFVMLRWARAFGVPLTSNLTSYFERILDRSSVRQALAEEGLVEEAPVIRLMPEPAG